MASIEKCIGKRGPTWRIRWRDESGKEHAKSFARRNFAIDFRIKLENDLRQGFFVTPSDIVLSDYIDSWIEAHKLRITENTYRSYLVPIKHIKMHLGNKPLQKLHVSDIENMYIELAKDKSNTYVTYVHRVLNVAMKNAEKQRIINRNPCAFVTPPKKEGSSAKIIEPVNISLYLNAFKDHYLYAAVCLGLFCGLRNSEVLGLTWDNIDWTKSLLVIDHSIFWRNSKEFEIVPTKSKQNRSVPLTDGMITVLKEQKKLQQSNKEILWNKYHKSNFIITRPDGSLIHTRYLSKQFTRKIKSAGLNHIRFHDLRHTCASLMLLEGENLKNISEILGHSTITITADTYIHIVDEMKRKAVNKLDKYMNNKS